MRVGDLFAGIGGFSLGLEWAGMETVWQVERDEFCQKVLAKHWPSVTRYGDIHDLIAAAEIGTVEPVDLIAGGPPCQPASVAGKHSKSYNNQYSPWQTNFHAMAIKTVLKHLLSKYGVMSVELVNALEQESEDQVSQDEAANANQDVIDVDPSMGEATEGPRTGPSGESPPDEVVDAPGSEPETAAAAEEPGF